MSVFIVLKPPYDRQALQDLNSELASYGLESYDFDFNRQYDYDLLPWLQLTSYEKLIHRLKTMNLSH